MKCLVCKTEISEDEEFEITIKVAGVEAKLCNRCGKKLAAEMVERGASIEAQMETPPELYPNPLVDQHFRAVFHADCPYFYSYTRSMVPEVHHST